MVGIADRLSLDAAQTRRRLDPNALPFETTAEVAPLRGTIGQTRALEAIDAAGEFHVWAVEHVDEGIELLTGHPAGARGPDGAYPGGSVHRRVEDRLHNYAIRLREFNPDGARRSTAAHSA